MSVYARERKETVTQYIVTAQKLQTVTIQILMNEKKFPKKWRYILVQDAILKVNEILDNVIAAHNLFPTTEERLKQRKQSLYNAVIGCYQLENKLLCMVRTINGVTAENVSNITSLILDEITLLKKAYKNAKIIGDKEV